MVSHLLSARSGLPDGTNTRSACAAKPSRGLRLRLSISNRTKSFSKKNLSTVKTSGQPRSLSIKLTSTMSISRERIFSPIPLSTVSSAPCTSILHKHGRSHCLLSKSLSKRVILTLYRVRTFRFPI